MDNTLDLTNLTLVFTVKDTKLRAVVGVSCCLSILGSLLIILSYILFKKQRTRAREILLHISLMDLGVALANLIGLSVYFDRFYVGHETVPSPAYIEGLCKTQAFFANYCTISSIVWTIALAGFLYFLIIRHKTRISIYFHRTSRIVCYALPLLTALWLVLTDRLGYSPLDSSGWCTLISSQSMTPRIVDFYAYVFGNDLWIFMATVTIPILYLSIRCHLSNQVKEMENHFNAKRFWSSLNHVDYKFVIIPVVFVFLRIWTEIMNILFLYVQISYDTLPESVTLALLYLSGIGDSSQGFANAIIFVIFTKNIREGFIQCFCCRKPQKDGLDVEAEAYSNTSHLNTVGSDQDKLLAKETPSAASIINENEGSLVFEGLKPSVNSKHSGVLPHSYGLTVS